MGVENSKLKSPQWQDAQEIYFFFSVIPSTEFLFVPDY